MKRKPLVPMLILWLLLSLSLAVFTPFLKAVSEAPPTEWSKIYGVSEGYLEGDSIVQTDDGGYVMVGRHYVWNPPNFTLRYSGGWVWKHTLLIKTDSAGNQIWKREYANERFYGLLKTSDGGYALAFDGGLSKMDSHGNLSWTVTYLDDISVVHSFIETSDGGYALVGEHEGIVLVKTDARGYMQWKRTYGGEGDYFPRSLIQKSDEGYAIISYTSSLTFGYNSIWLLKTDSLGNMQWHRVYRGYQQGMQYDSTTASSGIETSDEGYMLVGRAYATGNPISPEDISSALAIKTDSQGNIHWNKTYGINTYGSSVLGTPDEGYVLTKVLQRESKTELVKIDAFGNAEWNATYGDPAFNLSMLIITADGGFALLGKLGNDMHLIKIAAPTYPLSRPPPTFRANIPVVDPSIQWQHFFLGTSGYSVIRSRDGGYLVLGQNVSSVISSLLIKTDASGNVSWVKTYRFGGNDTQLSFIISTNDGGYALAGTHNIFYGQYGFTIRQFCLIKTDSEGNEQWSKVYPSGFLGETPNAFFQTSDGGYAIIGQPGAQSFVKFVKTDIEGNIQWTSIFRWITDIGSAVQTKDGGYFILGTPHTLLKIDSNGNAQWNKTYEYPTEGVRLKSSSFFSTVDGGYLLGGNIENRSGWQYGWLVKIDADTNMTWSKDYEKEGLFIKAITQTQDGGYGFTGITANYDVSFVKTDALGNIQKEVDIPVFGADKNKPTQSIIKTNDDGYVITGQWIGVNNTTYERIWLFKIALFSSTPTDVTFTLVISAVIIATLVSGFIIYYKKRKR